MYWSRTGEWTDLALSALQALMWWTGGGLLVPRLRAVPARERLLLGLGLGLALTLTITNLLAHVLPFAPAWWAAAVCVALAGLASGRNARASLAAAAVRPSAWGPLLALALLTLLFSLINRGLAIFDDYHNLPLVSVMAAGDVPPHFYLNPDLRLAYHYGLHLLAAGWVRSGGMFPWSAFDLAKALSLALALTLGWAWFRRHLREGWTAAGLTALLALATGTRWLLLFASPPWLMAVSERVELLGSAAQTGTDLFNVLGSGWVIAGGGPLPFPFAYVNGVIPPLIFALGGPGALPIVTLLLLLLLWPRRWTPFAVALYALVLASLALSAEVLFVLACVGLALAWIASASPRSGAVVAVLTLATLLAALQGGVLTEIVRGGFDTLRGLQTGSYGFGGFGWGWPPALISAHLGHLALFDPDLALVAVAELGPLILLAPLAFGAARARLRRGELLAAGLPAAAAFGLLISLILRYAVERDTTRISESALRIWLVLGLPLLILWLRRGGGLRRAVAAPVMAAAVFGGVVLLAFQLLSIPRPVASYFIQGTDARIGAAWWDRLPPDARVLDRVRYRPVALFGRAVHTSASLWALRPEVMALLADPDPARIWAEGFDYVYMDEIWWRGLDPAQQARFRQPCAVIVHEEIGPGDEFRWLVSLGNCH